MTRLHTHRAVFYEYAAVAVFSRRRVHPAACAADARACAAVRASSGSQGRRWAAASAPPGPHGRRC